MGSLFRRWIVSEPHERGLRALFALPSEYAGAKLTTRRLLNLYLNRLEKLATRQRLASYPLKLTVETTNICNLRCPACFTGAGLLGRARSHMTPEFFQRLLSELGPYLFEVEFHNWGEPLLAKHLFPMIEDAARFGLRTTISTNFSFPFSDEKAERLVASGLTVLGVSIDGATQESYEQYRRGGNLELVLENCRRIRDAKRRSGATTPKLIWEFHVFAHNTHEIERATELARGLDMEIAVDKGWTIGPDWDRARQFNFWMQPRAGRCVFLYSRAVVNNDGGVAPCCGTFFREDDLGELATEPSGTGAKTFREVWNGQKFRLARGLFAGPATSDDARQLICHDCLVTTTWAEYKQHLAVGGAPEAYQPRYETNDGFNFFWKRRPRREAPAA